MYVLDTNVISELRKGKPGQAQQVRAWAAGHPVSQLFLSAITVLEMEIGTQLMERRDDAQGAVLRHWADRVQVEFDSRVLAFTSLTAKLCASLHVPDKRSFRDSMIAATAIEHAFAIVTRNVRDFEGMGLRIIDPWEASAGTSSA